MTKAEIATRQTPDVRKLSSSELLVELGRAISVTAASVAYLAACWCELERRGEDLSGLKIGLAPYLRDIAEGRLASEAVVAFAGQRLVLRWLTSLPIDDQRRLAGGAPVTVIGDDGSRREVPLTKIDARELAHVQRPGAPGGTPLVSRRGRKKIRTEPTGSIAFAVSESEKKRLVAEAHAAGVSLSDLLREKLGLVLRVEAAL